ncbi:MAG: Ig-like domain repeat protein [Planctomycetota bacterium]
MKPNRKLSSLFKDCSRVSLVIAVTLFGAVTASRQATAQLDLQKSSRRIEGTRLAQDTSQVSTRRSPSPIDPAPADPKRVATNLRGFGVPFAIDANNDAFIEVQLYLSTDKGRNWKYYGRQSTDKNEFPFQAKEDGEHWFALKTLNRDRRLVPSGDPQPELKVIIDSQKPALDFRVQTDAAGRVLCRWQATDLNLKTDSLKIFYQPIRADGTLKNWLKVPVSLSGQARNGVYADQIGWWPETTESMVNVAVEIQDTAGNVTRVDRRVALPKTAWRNRNVATARPNTTSGNANRNVVSRPSLNNSNLSNGPPKQPDWAQPDWKSPSSQQPAQRLIPQSAQSKPANVVCENGICRTIESDPDPSTGETPVRTASSSTYNVPLVSPHHPPIGSPEEYVDPPIPPGYRVAQSPTSNSSQQAASKQRPSPQHSQLWQSDNESWLPRNQQSTSSTTRRIDPSIMPRGKQIATSPTTFVPSNPSTMKVQGNQVISQSSTMGPSNQYRGGKREPLITPRTELLPNVAKASDQGWNTSQPSRSGQGDNANQTAGRFPQTDSAPFQETNGSMRRINTLPNQTSDQRSGQFSTAKFQRNSQRPVVGAISEKPNRATNAAVSFVSTKRFRLPYGIDAIDPSGVGKVDLWITTDDGQTWKNWGTDPDSVSPFPVEVQNDGRYGFRVVVHSKDGLAGVGPSAGDDADLWVNVDTQAPLAQIQSAPYGRGDYVGKLIVNYRAGDNFLTLRPVTLSYATNPEGPWQEIESGLRNESMYVWNLNRHQVPDNVFLKIEVVDRAGNVGQHILSQPIDLTGLKPRGTIHGVTPVGK